MSTNRTDRWLLPEGVEEALPEQAWQLESSRRELIDLYKSWGYDLVMPPFIEYLESLLTGIGRDLDIQTFKLTDQLNGRMMGVRADITPQVARIDAHRLKQEGPTRLCYLGTVLRTRPDGFAGSRSPLQIGAELYGHSGVDADREIVSLLIETLSSAGVEDIYLGLGHVGFLRGLAGHYGFDDEARATFFEMLQRKAVTELAEWLDAQDLDDEAKAALLKLPLLCGDKSILDEAGELFASAGEAVLGPLTVLTALTETLEEAYPAINLHFDLAEINGFNYETGIVFAAYTRGEGEQVARGGRYDGIGRDFGRERPAVGFSADLKRLVRLSSAGKTAAAPRRIFAPQDADAQTVASLRKAGDVVVRELEGQSETAAEAGCDYLLVSSQGQWLVEKTSS